MTDVGGGVWIRCHDDPSQRPRRANTSIVIADNVIDGTTRDDGIRLISASDAAGGDGQIYCASVTGNIVRHAKTNGIRIVWAPEARISDNSVFVTGARGIEASSSALSVISHVTTPGNLS